MGVSMEVEIKIENGPEQLEFELFDNLYVDDREVEIGNNIIARYIYAIDDVIEFLIVLPDTAVEGASSIIASWLHEKLKDKELGALLVANKKTLLDLDDITKKISEEINSST